jgi:hypothetical protein
MRILLARSIALFAMVTATSSQITGMHGQEEWIKTFGGEHKDRAFEVAQTADGGYILAGTIGEYAVFEPPYQYYGDAYIVKTNSAGDTLWTRTLGGESVDEARSVQQTRDGGYIVAGSTSSFGADYSIYLMRLNALGDTIWTRLLGTGPGKVVRQTSDGGFIILADSIIYKTDSLGAYEWSSDLDLFAGHSITQARDGGYVVCGTTDFMGHDILVLKTDSVGGTIWSKTFREDTLFNAGFSVVETEDGGYFVVGTVGYNPSGPGADWLGKAYAIRLSASGDSLWTKSIWNPEYYSITGYSGDQTDDGGYVIAGYVYASGTRLDLFMAKLDEQGDLLWMRSTSWEYYDQARCIRQTHDGGFILVGWMQFRDTQNVLQQDILLIKTDEIGSLLEIRETSEGRELIPLDFALHQNYPNPFNPSTTIRYDLHHAGEVSLTIYDLLGQEVARLVDGNMAPGCHEVQWDGREFASGIYIARLVTPGYSKAIKMVLLK